MTGISSTTGIVQGQKGVSLSDFPLTNSRPHHHQGHWALFCSHRKSTGIRCPEHGPTSAKALNCEDGQTGWSLSLAPDTKRRSLEAWAPVGIGGGGLPSTSQGRRHVGLPGCSLQALGWQQLVGGLYPHPGEACCPHPSRRETPEPLTNSKTIEVD